jgi:MFS family permease
MLGVSRIVLWAAKAAGLVGPKKKGGNPAETIYLQACAHPEPRTRHNALTGRNLIEEAGNQPFMSTRSTPAAEKNTPSYLGPFITVTALFFIFGFITNLNMALVPHLRSIFTLPYAWAMLAESAFFLAYFVFSSPTSKLIEAIGYKRTMVVSLFIQVVGCLLFVPAAKLVSFPLFLTAVFIVGAGVTALQTAANPYVAILGPEHSAPVRLTLAQALNSLGGSIAPLIAGHYILTDPAKMQSKAAIADTVRGPYIAIAGGLLILGIAVAFMHLPHIQQTQSLPARQRRRSIAEPQHLELPAYGARRCRHLSSTLAWRSAWPRSRSITSLRREINSAKVASFFPVAGWLRRYDHALGPWTNVEIAAILLALLVRRADWPPCSAPGF